MNIALSLMMLGALALLAGGAYLWIARGQRKQASLMFVLVVVMLANVAIWTVPDQDGVSPLDQASQQ